MKRLLAFVILAVASYTPAWAYNFSAVAPSGQTLYYNIVYGNAEVTYPGSSEYAYYYGYTTPAGELIIPNCVECDGYSYSVTSIGSGAFSDCVGLTYVTIPNSVTDIGTCAFQNCSGLISITIPNSATDIGVAAFWCCRGLTSVTIGNSVTNIGDYAFCDCSNVDSILVGSEVVTIGDGALSGCTHLTTIISRAEYPPICRENTFYGVPAYADIIVHCGTKYRYELTDYWNDFTRITEDCTDIDNSDLEGNICIYTVNGRIFVKNADGVSLTLFDAAGRQLAERLCNGMPQHFDVPTSGTYLIKIGAYPARKVVAIR